MSKDIVLTMKDCGFCNDLKDKGMCEKFECVDVSTSKGQKIAKDLKITSTPTRVCKDTEGNLKKCSMTSIYKKFS